MNSVIYRVGMSESGLFVMLVVSSRLGVPTAEIVRRCSGASEDGTPDLPYPSRGLKTHKLEEVTTKDQLDVLYSSSALTAEGLVADDESVAFLANWLEENGAEPQDELTIYVVKGSLMNESYGLTGDNAYQDDLPIVCIPLDEMGNSAAIAVPRLLLGFRWFDDVVNNSLLNEKMQSESSEGGS